MVWTQLPDDELDGVDVDFFTVRREGPAHVAVCNEVKAPSVWSLHAISLFEQLLNDISAIVITETVGGPSSAGPEHYEQY